MRRLFNISLLLMVVFLPACEKRKVDDNIWGIKPIETDFIRQPPVVQDFKPTVQPTVPTTVETIPVQTSRDTSRVVTTPFETAPFAMEAATPVRPNMISVNETGSFIVSTTYPSKGYGIIQVDKVMPKEVGISEPFDYSLKISNLTDTTLSNIVITEEFPRDFEFTGSNPVARKELDKCVWKIDSLGPKSNRHIIISGRGVDTNYLECRTTITHGVQVRANVKIVQPQLNLAMTVPVEVLLCDPIPVEFLVTNVGTGSAQNVKILQSLPSGLQTIDGKSELVFEVGILGAGQSERFSSQLQASKTGTFINKAIASSTAGLVAESTPKAIKVRQPKIKIVKNCPNRQYLGRPLVYEITIANEGDGPAKNTIVEDTIPADVTSIEASAGAKLSGTKLIWDLGTLEPNGSRKVRVSYVPTKSGTSTNTAIANAYCAQVATVSASTAVIGIAAAHLEVIDLEDPIEVGGRTTYVITVSNHGSAPDTNIRVVCTLEDKVQYLSSAGATAGSLMGNTVSFSPLSSLAPKDRATWRIVVKGTRPGDVRFRVTMSSDQLARPVEETVATYIYE